MECWDDDRKEKGAGGSVQEKKYRIIYSGERNNRNGVGIIISPHLSEQVVQTFRQTNESKTDFRGGGGGGEMENIISAYASQVGEKKVNKEKFTKDLECMINNIPQREKVII